jgi:hypothetical protein
MKEKSATEWRAPSKDAALPYKLRFIAIEMRSASPL